MKIINVIIIIFLFINSVEAKKKTLDKDAREGLDSLIQNAKRYLAISSGIAIDYADEVLKAFDRDAKSPIVADAYGVLGEAYYSRNEYKEALKYYTKELEVRQQFADKQTLMIAFFNIGVLNKDLSNNRKAISYYETSLELAKELGDKDVMIKNYEALSSSYHKTGNYKNAYNNYKSFVLEKDEERQKEISIIKIRYDELTQLREKEIKEREAALMRAKEKEETLKKDVKLKNDKIEELHTETLEKEEEIKDKEEEIKVKEEVILEKQETVEQQNKIIYFAVAGFLLILFNFLLLFRQYKQKKKANKLLAFKNEQIESQRDEIENQRDKIANQNKNITDSISYASKIQKAILPKKNVLKYIFTDHFILYQPRDIVSGDFFWFSKVRDQFIMAAADCTGHGVPGAFMSMLGTAFLNELVNKERITQPDEILNELRDHVIKTLKQGSKRMKNSDGMDIALFTLDLKTHMLTFSGANNPIYFIRNGSLEVIKGSRMPIGIYRRMEAYQKHEVQLKKGDSIYIFSDGYSDQFGGREGKKLKKSKFQELLLENKDKPMSEQEDYLTKYMKKWKGRNDQVDDILVVGLKI